MPKTAKLIKNGSSQAVRLRAECRLPGKEVAIRRDEATGDVILSPIEASQKSWHDFFELAAKVGVPGDLMADRSLQMPTERDFFD